MNNLYIVVGHDPKYDDNWCCHDVNNNNVFEEKYMAEVLRDFLASGQGNIDSGYTYRVVSIPNSGECVSE